MLSCIIEKEHKAKILIIDANYLNRSIHEIFGMKKTKEPTKYKNTNIYIMTLEDSKCLTEVNKYKSMFDLILIDTSYFDNNIEEILKISDKNIFLTESSLICISKLKKLVDILNIKDKKESNFIIYNKVTKNTMDRNILKHIFYELSYLGSIDFRLDLEKYINKHNLYGRILDSKEKNSYIKIINKLFRIKKKKRNILISFITKIKKTFFYKEKEELVYGTRNSFR